ncbi:lachesin-like [Melanaphis sacchari]|uniref:lachesin-like n=1 Tax=Melanaphis sacchari TaxID=742174 RepID=UPI000DC14C61|nr:lachesin-like [Melanaphis sacchari]
MKYIYGVLFLLCIKLAYSQRTPIITHITQKLIKDIGDTVELACTTFNTKGFNVLWVKVIQEPIIFSFGSTLIVNDPRISLIQDIDSNQYILKIDYIQETDASIYRCDVVIGINNKISAYTELIVRKRPFIYKNSTRSLVVIEGQSVQLECYAGGYPRPRISWRRANNAILSIGGSMYRGNVLKIPAITKEDRGTYYCIAENGFGKGARHNIAIEVKFAPVITALQTSLGQAVHFDIDLKCRVEAYPPPAIVWLKNGVELFNNHHYSISLTATTYEITDTTLQIITIENHQYGDYICKASNILGTTEITITVYETLLPECPPVCDD